MSLPLIYQKPLSLEDRLLIDTVTARYEGIGESWVAFEHDDYIELRCPERIRDPRWSNGKSIPETPRGVFPGLSNG